MRVYVRKYVQCFKDLFPAIFLRIRPLPCISPPLSPARSLYLFLSLSLSLFRTPPLRSRQLARSLYLSLSLSFSRVQVLDSSRMFYGVASISRLLKIIGLFCKRALKKRLYSAKETYDFKEPTNQSHPIPKYYVYIVCRYIF